MLLGAGIFLLGDLLLTACQNMAQLVATRFVIGLASGVQMVVVPVYLGEIAPPTLRGTLGACTQFAIVIGVLSSNLMAFPLATPRLLFSVTPALSLLQQLLSPYLVESPRFLLAHDEHSLQARADIQRLRQHSDVEAEGASLCFLLLPLHVF